MTGEDFVDAAVLHEVKAKLFDELMTAIEKHRWKIENQPADADYYDTELYDAFHHAQRIVREVKGV